MGQKFYEENLALKHFANLPKEKKPSFDWSNTISLDHTYSTQSTDNLATNKHAINLEQIADIVGGALTNLLLAKNDLDIFNDRNRAFTSEITHAVALYIKDNRSQYADEIMSLHDMNKVIETVLVAKDAHDVARSLLIQRTSNPEEALSYSKLTRTLELSTRLIRRDGQVVPWDQSKVEIAVRKAFLSLQLDSEPATLIAQAISQHIQKLALTFVDIEYVQDLVQQELMRQGHYKVAEVYILYRAHRRHLREVQENKEVSANYQGSMLLIEDDANNSSFWDGSELRKRIEFASIGLDLCLSPEAIEQELRRSLYANITQQNLKKTIILNAKTLIERDADFAQFAGRILLSYIYEEVLPWNLNTDSFTMLKDAHVKGFKSYIHHGIQIQRLSPEVSSYDLDVLAAALDPSADLKFDYLGIQTLYDRYLLIDKTQKVPVRIETLQYFWMRVAMGVCLNETDKEDRAIRLYQLYKSRRFCSSTPTLFNAGTLHPQLSSCYLYKVDDSIESIMYRGIAENAFLSKWAGGLGGSWTAVRGMGSFIKGTNGSSRGVIPFLKVHNDLLEAVDQGGKRGGSGCAYLEVWHSDFLAFLELRKNTGDERMRTHSMNTASWIPDLFMKRMEGRENWTLFHSNEVPDLHELYGKAFEARYVQYEALAAEGKIFSKQILAIDLWKKMLAMLFETGHPWITFKDPCNVRNPQSHAGVIHSSNLCTEITLNTGPEETAVCNLGSIILENHLKSDGSIDTELLRETIQIAVRALDNVIDINFYPTVAASTSNKRHRPIGLGVMGLQNALYRKGISFASDEAVEFSDEFMEQIAFYAYEASSDLALERGKYSSYEGSKWSLGLLPQDTIDLLEAERSMPIIVPRDGKLDWTPVREKIRKHGMRNSNVIAIAPTATISNIMGSSPCIEPTYKNLYVKSNLSGDFIKLNDYLVRDLKKLGLWSADMLEKLKYFDGELTNIDEIPENLKKLYYTAFDIPYEYVIDAAGRRQKWIDQAQSLNTFLKEPDIKAISHMMRRGFHCGLKTFYYFKTLGASNIEKATINVKKAMRGVVGQVEIPTEEKLTYTPAQVAACSIDSMLNGTECEACQ